MLDNVLLTLHVQGGGKRGPQQAGGGAGALQTPRGGTQVGSEGWTVKTTKLATQHKPMNEG